jgi:branched-chain amino acid transport system ATP-binding protein
VVRRIAAGGVTVVLIEHVMRFLLALSERVIIMHQGRTLYEGPPEGVAEDAGVVETYLGRGATKRLKAHFAGAAHA